VSRILHPWRLAASTPQPSKEVEGQLQAELKAIDTLLEPNGLALKKDPWDTVRKQRAGLSALVDFGWQTGPPDVEQMTMPPRWTQGADE
jgi:hypothetical protein